MVFKKEAHGRADAKRSKPEFISGDAIAKKTRCTFLHIIENFGGKDYGTFNRKKRISGAYRTT
jgi:hypothetical protein